MGNTKSKQELFFDACINNNLDNAIKLSKFKKVNKFCQNNKAFNDACTYSSLDIITWLGKFNEIEINKNLLKKLIKENNLEVIIILSNLNKIKLNNNLFQLACCHNLDIVLWIYEIGNIDINANGNKALLNACIHQKVDIMLWLLKNNSDMEYNDDYIFKKVCKFGLIDIAEILCNNRRYKFEKHEDILLPIVKAKDIFYIENKYWYDLIEEFNIKIDDNFEPDECLITYEDSEIKTNCNHHYKFEELMNWYLKKNTCPACESKIILNKCTVDKKFTEY